MIERIIEFSIRNRFLIILIWVGVAIWGVHAVINTPIDAIPDLSENQVIVFTDWMGRSPKEIEDQITYPLSVNLQGLAGVKAVRSTSEFNFSMINVIFDDNIDFYFARDRVSERLRLADTILPQGVKPYMAPEATALGQIFWYTIEGEGQDLGRLRAIQDFNVKYAIKSVQGVADVASVGGMPIEYQIDVDPNKLRAYNVTLGELYSAVARANSSVGGKVIQKGGSENIIRGVGWIKGLRDIERIVVKSEGRSGTPITVAQLGTVGRGGEFRRSVLEKNGSEAVGAVVMMRHGENPLEVTERIKDKIREIQPGLPEGIRIVPFYDRTRLIHGAIDNVSETLIHEMIIASVAILLILVHFRSAVAICITLPLAVLVSFILMRYLKVPSNIMSLSGIAISIGILVDQAIVMVENATHNLTAHFGPGRRIEGDTREIVIKACRTVGKPIFFSVMIILLSFIPVFALTGREGKTFHPLAFTKSFAMIGVAILSVTLVPALIPSFIRGRLRSEEESWLVRSLIGIYKPWLTWMMPRRNFAMWSFSALLICGAGLFPLNALVGLPYRTCFLAVVAVTMLATLLLIVGLRWQLLSFLTLSALALSAYGWPKIGCEYMPPLDEGSFLDMPITVPRVSVTQAARDLRMRDGIIRGFPEVELIVGKAGRADTPTDPSPIDMVESVITLRPKEHWPRRKLKFEDAVDQTSAAMTALQKKKLIDEISDEAQRRAILDPAAMNAAARFDETMRTMIVKQFTEFDGQLGQLLLREFIERLTYRLNNAGRMLAPATDADLDKLTAALQKPFAAILAAGPGQADVDRLMQGIAEKLASPEFGRKVQLNPELLAPDYGTLHTAWLNVAEVLGVRRPTLFTDMWDFCVRQRDSHWQAQVEKVNDEILGCAAATFNTFAVEELRKIAQEKGNWAEKTDDGAEQRTIDAVRAELDTAWTPSLFLWQKSKTDLEKELDSVVRVPGWSNIWTQPIINRINMLATGVRTDIGVKVYGTDLDQIQKVAQEVAEVLAQVPGAVGIVPDQSTGKGYLEIRPDLDRAKRYGVNVGDIWDVVEVALGGRAITTTVEDRERFPVRVRYARSYREDEEDVKNLLINAPNAPVSEAGGGGMGGSAAAAGNSAPGPARQIPLSMVADVRVVEGPAMINSENGMLLYKVQLSVRDRDMLGFVDEAQRAVAQKVKLPPGMSLTWSGEFENQLHARNTTLVIFPAVFLVIFVILYLTYNDFVDAVLMMMCVPEAIVGGIFVLWLTQYHFLGLNPTRYSVAVLVGFIACFGMATETGIIMLVYLREAIEKRGGLEKIATLAELRDAVIEGAVHRLRPKLLTEGVAIIALAPMLWVAGVGHEVVSAMAAPVLGGLLIADEVVDIFIPVRFYWTRRSRWLKMRGIDPATAGYDTLH
jgi:Cu(I)/Ag(I) efflux system membrane protein CusA/SilA